MRRHASLNMPPKNAHCDHFGGWGLSGSGVTEDEAFNSNFELWNVASPQARLNQAGREVGLRCKKTSSARA